MKLRELRKYRESLIHKRRKLVDNHQARKAVTHRLIHTTTEILKMELRYVHTR